MPPKKKKATTTAKGKGKGKDSTEKEGRKVSGKACAPVTFYRRKRSR